MAEEELKLIVTVDDQASAQIQRMQTMMGQLGTGSSGAGMARASRQTREIGQGAGEAAAQMNKFAVTAGVVGGLVGGLTSRLAGAAGEFINNIATLRTYSTNVQELSQRSYAAGLSMAQYKSAVGVFKEVGVSAEAAGQQIQNLGDTQSDLLLANSRTRRELMAGLAPERVAEMDARLQEIAQADRPRALQLSRQLVRDIRSEWTAAQGAAVGADQERRAAAILGIPDIAKTRRDFAAVTADQEAMWEKRDAEAAKFESITVKTEGSLKRGTTAIQGALFAALPINDTMEGILNRTIAWAERMEEVEKFFRLSREEQEKMLQAKGQTYFEGLTPRGKALAVTSTGEVPETEGEIKFNRIINSIVEKFGFQAGGPETSAVGGAAKKAADFVQTYIAEPLGLGGEQPAAPPTPLPRPKPTSPELVLQPETPPPSILRVTPPEARPLVPTLNLPQPTTPLITPPAPAPSVLRLPPEAAPAMPSILRTAPLEAQPIIVPRSAETPQAASAPPPFPIAPAAALPSILRTVPPEAQPIIVPQTEAQPIIVPQTEAQPAPAPRFELPVTAQPVAPLPSILRQPPQPEPTFESRFGDWPQQPAAPTPTTPPSILRQPQQPQPQQPQMPFRFDALEQAPQAPRVNPANWDQFSREAPRSQSEDRRGELQPQQSSQDWMRQLPTPQQLAPQTVNVNGEGKIKVEVTAPPDTHVSAEGSGLFKSTEITRMTQMMPADFGPIPATGVGAAEGSM